MHNENQLLEKMPKLKSKKFCKRFFNLKNGFQKIFNRQKYKGSYSAITFLYIFKSVSFIYKSLCIAIGQRIAYGLVAMI